MTEKQGFGDEGETREAREGKRGKTQRRVSVRQRGDPGEIQGRSIDLRSSEFETRKDPETGVRETKGRSRGDPGKIHRSKEFGVQGCRRK